MIGSSDLPLTLLPTLFSLKTAMHELWYTASSATRSFDVPNRIGTASPQLSFLVFGHSIMSLCNGSVWIWWNFSLFRTIGLEHRKQQVFQAKAASVDQHKLLGSGLTGFFRKSVSLLRQSWWTCTGVPLFWWSFNVWVRSVSFFLEAAIHSDFNSFSPITFIPLQQVRQWYIAWISSEKVRVYRVFQRKNNNKIEVGANFYYEWILKLALTSIFVKYPVLHITTEKMF